MEAGDWTGSWLEVRAAQTPDRVALEFDGVSTRYAELWAEAESLAGQLEALGVRRGDVVAAWLGNGPEMPRLLWALQAIGAVLLPLNTRLLAEEAAFLLGDADARLLVHGGGPEADPARAAARGVKGLSTAVLDGLRLDGVAGLAQVPGPEAREDLAGILAVIYTSGTTGTPKGALLPGAAFLASARASERLLGTDAADRWLACMPLFHVGGLSILLRACLAGSSVVVHRGFDPRAVAEALDRGAITGVSLVATMLQRLLEVRGGASSPTGLERMLIGGGPAPQALLERAHALGYPLAPTYGLTEAASQVATRLPADSAPPFHGRLRALPGTELRVVGSDGQGLAPGEVGEICVRGPTLMRAYLGQPEASARALRHGWLHTGDVGTLDDEGGLTVLDRRDDLIVSGGENIYPGELESVIAGHPAVAEVAVVAAPDAEFGAHPVAWWVAEAARPGEPAQEPDLAAYCRGRLAAYKLPRRFVRVESLPRNAAGKVLRRELRVEGR